MWMVRRGYDVIKSGRKWECGSHANCQWWCLGMCLKHPCACWSKLGKGFEIPPNNNNNSHLFSNKKKKKL